MSRRRIVVVGAGTSGSVVSMSLATRSEHEIIVVESGVYSGLDGESRFMNVLADSSLQSLHQVQLVANGPTVPYVQAHCVGGGSAINGMLLTSEVPDVAQGLTSFPQKDELGDVGRALLDAGGEYTQLWWNNGRWNPGRALLHLIDHERIRIISDNVLEVLQSGATAGVRLQESVIEADAVVMCAGAIATPKILLQSGFSRFNTQIGLGLQDHPSITFALELHREIPSVFDAGVVRRGTTSMGEQYLVVAYERASWSEPELGLVSVLLLTPHSRGWVTARDHECDVQINMLDDERDVVAMREAVQSLIETVSHESFRAIARDIYADDEGTSVESLHSLTITELDKWIKMNLRPVSHVAASCHQAVNDDGSLQHVGGVFIADASVLSGVPPSTPAAPVTMEARRIARLVEGSLS